MNPNENEPGTPPNDPPSSQPASGQAPPSPPPPNDPPTGGPPPFNQPPPAAETAAPGHSPEQRQWAMFAHLSAIVGGLLTAGWAGSIGVFIGPLIIWMVKKDTMPFVDDQGKEALNFNITVGIVFLALLLLSVLTLGIGLIIAIPAWIIIGIAWLVFAIIGGIKANEGVAYRYPLTMRLIK